MLYYVPLEGYKERYTLQWSAPKTGWLERNWIRTGVNYERIEGSTFGTPRTIKSGSVVDAVGRSVFCFEQIEQLLYKAEAGTLTSEDVIYFDDFWTPGLEALPYAFHLLGVYPKMYAFLHAQSVDIYDFTHPMRHWMRPFETGIGAALDGIFVCCPLLQDLVVQGGIAPASRVHITGHPFNSEEVRERMPKILPEKRENNVVWSSRWDEEKNPQFFLRIAMQMASLKRDDIKFIICTGAPRIKSNNDQLLKILSATLKVLPNNVILKENLSKEEYYEILANSKIQFNSANQDFVAITLLESAVAGCYPIYPNFRSFPETFWNHNEFLYAHLDLDAAVSKIINVIDQDDLWTNAKVTERAWLYDRFDFSWLRMLKIMEVPYTYPTVVEPQLSGLYPEVFYKHPRKGID